MKAVTLVVFVLALASYAFAACSSTAATTCDTNYDNCVNFGSATPTCECTIAYRTCMTNAGCCSTANTTDDCDVRCNANCGDAACVWPPPLSDNCAQRSTCQALNNCAGTNCRCEVSLRQCLLFQGCSYNSTLSTSCETDCASRTPSPDCSAKAATLLPSPSAPAGCVATPPYLQAGDCTCRDEMRSVAPTATCASGAWTIAGPFALGSLVEVQYDTVNINGDFTVGTSGTLAFTYASNTDAGRVVVSGTATIQGKITVFISNPDSAAGKTLTLLTATTVSVPDISKLNFPTVDDGLCLLNRQYNTPTTDIRLTYQVSSNPQDCSASQSPAATPTAATTGVAPRPTPIKYTPPPGEDSVSALSLFSAVALLVASLVAKYL